jgi:hypothetical protein
MRRNSKQHKHTIDFIFYMWTYFVLFLVLVPSLHGLYSARRMAEISRQVLEKSCGQDFVDALGEHIEDLALTTAAFCAQISLEDSPFLAKLRLANGSVGRDALGTCWPRIESLLEDAGYRIDGFALDPIDRGSPFCEIVEVQCGVGIDIRRPDQICRCEKGEYTDWIGPCIEHAYLRVCWDTA